MCRCQCGWPVYGGLKIEIACPRCGALIQCDGKEVEQPKPQESQTCLHRGPSVGKASCGCGTIFLCERLGGYCGDRVILEYAQIGADVLTKENYRRCGECKNFSSGPELVDT